MKFIDEARISISAGHGGPGCVSFRRETFVPRGGPDGGDGGAGGNVVFLSSVQLGTLQDFKFKRIYQAQNGSHGSGAHKSGKSGEDIIIKVPVGTVIKDATTGEVLIDLVNDQQEWIACKGGRGGKGNSHFATSTHQAPKFAQPGEEGESRQIQLELKLLADVAIIGFPNVGKSTLISRLSAAHPKIADYPFTTLTPNLGVVSLPDLSSFVIADIPGLVEGAHRGKGLGTRFLKHIERTRLFLHVLDCTDVLEELTQIEGFDGDESSSSSPVQRSVLALRNRYEAIRKELGLFNEKLLHKPEIVVLNKSDVLASDPHLLQGIREGLRREIAILNPGVLPQLPLIISAVSGQSLDELVYSVSRELNEIKARALNRADKEGGIELPDSQKIRS